MFPDRGSSIYIRPDRILISIIPDIGQLDRSYRPTVDVDPGLIHSQKKFNPKIDRVDPKFNSHFVLTGDS